MKHCLCVCVSNNAKRYGYSHANINNDMILSVCQSIWFSTIGIRHAIWIKKNEYRCQCNETSQYSKDYEITNFYACNIHVIIFLLILFNIHKTNARNSYDLLSFIFRVHIRNETRSQNVAIDIKQKDRKNATVFFIRTSLNNMQ